MSASIDLRVGDVREQLRLLPDDLIHCVVTSPPYYQLRDYGTARWEGGDPDCDHTRKAGGTARSGLANYDNGLNPETIAKKVEEYGHVSYRDVCGKCGAQRVDQQLGLEATPQEYVANLVEIFREVRRVLRPDGVCFFNIGDSYAANRSYQVPSTKAGDVGNHHGSRVPLGLKPKDLCLVPQRLAIALQDDGWWVRSDIIWHKPNVMPSSAGDRPTGAHEYVWLLTKRAHYFWDKAAVMEPAAWERWGDQTVPKYEGTETASGWMKPRSKADLQRRRTPTWEERKAAGAMRGNLAFDGNVGAGTQRAVHGEGLSHDLGDPANGRNLRSVWTIPTESYPGAHFAVMAKKLAETAIRAGTSEKGCCPICGKPWLRISERRGIEGRLEPVISETRKDLHGPTYSRHRTRVEGGQSLVGATSETVGWRPDCSHEAPPIPCRVLDPFAGSGTTMVVARRLGRSSIGIELNEDYAAQAHERLASWWRDPAPARAEIIDGQLMLALDGAASDVAVSLPEADGDAAADAGMADVGDQPGAGAA